jgi:hypothetical protein
VLEPVATARSRPGRATGAAEEGAMCRAPAGLPRWLAVSSLCGLLLAACGGGGGAGGGATDDRLERWDAGGYSIDKPKGWTVHPAGACDILGLLVRDPQQPLRQLFYFSAIRPIYTTAAQKAFDEWYVSQGGHDIPWLDAPAVDPFTPENLMAHWPEIAAMKAATEYLAQFPRLDGLRVVAAAPRATMLPSIAGSVTAEVRGAFLSGGQVGEGMFVATTVPASPLLCTTPPSGPMGCTSTGYLVLGVTAPKAEFAGLAELLVASLNSFTVTQPYVDDCLRKATLQWNAVARAGQTLSEASDAIWDGWVSRTRAEDVTSEQYRDAFLGVERVYDPASGTVYEVPAGWYQDTYDPNRAGYDLGGLQPLPADAAYWDLWSKATLGASQIH